MKNYFENHGISTLEDCKQLMKDGVNEFVPLKRKSNLNMYELESIYNYKDEKKKSAEIQYG